LMHAVVVMVWCPCHAHALSLSLWCLVHETQRGCSRLRLRRWYLQPMCDDGPPISRLSLAPLRAWHVDTRCDQSAKQMCSPLPGVEARFIISGVCAARPSHGSAVRLDTNENARNICQISGSHVPIYYLVDTDSGGLCSQIVAVISDI
jgi:hypothetical protein